MIKIITDLLRSDDWIGCGNAIEIAKGKYELPKDFKGTKRKLIRKWQSRKSLN